MPRLLLLAACLLLPGAASAATQANPQQPDPHQQWEAKLASPFLM
jgi:hypothetical protein